MRITRNTITCCVLLALFACSGESPNEPAKPAHENIADDFSGQVAGTDQGTVLTGTFALIVSQEGSNLSGNWTLNANQALGATNTPVSVAGEFTGIIGVGEDPSVAISVVMPSCPVHQVQLIGKYETLGKRLNLNGSIPIFELNCFATYRYQSTLILQR